MTDDATAPDPWTDLDAYASLPRVGGHSLSPDGTRVVVGMATRDQRRNRYVTALWEVDPAGDRPARRLTRSAQGESSAAFTPAGDLLFVSRRPDPDGGDDRPVAALWLQPAGGGDARVVADPPGGVQGVTVSDSGTVVLGVEMFPGSTDLDDDREQRERRRDAKVTAILHEEYPIRHWDHDLGPGRVRLFTADVAGTDDRLTLTDLTGHVGASLDDRSAWDITPDGSTVVVSWSVPETGGSRRYVLVAIDVATGQHKVLADDVDHEYHSPCVSPDGTQVAMVVARRPTHTEADDLWLAVVPVAGGEIRELTRDWDRWPPSAKWTPDGRSLVCTADHDGRCPLWLVDVATGAVTRLTPDDGAYSDPAVSPDGRWAHALRSTIDSPLVPVRVALDGSGAIEPLRGPAAALDLPGTLTEVSTTAEDGATVRAWLALPHGASAEAPAPLLLKIHGGPTMSANSWTWRSSPWVFVARGYAVLMPDPALSTGYGRGFLQRGWTHRAQVPYDDLMRITDATQARPDVDDQRACAMGASFGGFMANWIAGHTDRFAAIASHASAWDRNISIETNDASHWFRRTLTFEEADAISPHHFADAITTPMLITHGVRDYRVPVSEALRLWWALSSRSKDDGTSPHKFLYFPDETHFISSPNNNRLWHEAVAAFFDHHVLGKPWERPDLIG